jgi:hypothetical protein
MVGMALAPGGWVCFVDGSEHRVVKVYYSPAGLAATLAELGWSAGIHETRTPLLVGSAHRARDP